MNRIETQNIENLDQIIGDCADISHAKAIGFCGNDNMVYDIVSNVMNWDITLIIERLPSQPTTLTQQKGHSIGLTVWELLEGDVTYDIKPWTEFIKYSQQQIQLID